MIRMGFCLPGLLLILSSCADNPPMPDDRYYRIPWTSTALTETKLTDGGLFVQQFIADGLYRERPLIHTADRSGIELLQYHYHHWVDSPARMLRDQLIRYLTESRAALHVVNNTDVPVDLAIHGKIKGFERYKYGNTDRVNVELEFRVDQTGNKVPLLISAYNVQIDVHGNSMNGVVTAYGLAISQVFAQLLADVSNKLIH
jgi:cholesterol transport system auxiliary component